jgi:hypothetical protein
MRSCRSLETSFRGLEGGRLICRQKAQNLKQLQRCGTGTCSAAVHPFHSAAGRRG